MVKFDPCPKRIENGKAIIISSTVFFISDRISEMMTKSQMNDQLDETLQLNHFEDLRSVVIQQMQSIQSESQKQLLIESIVCLKDMMRAYSED